MKLYGQLKLVEANVEGVPQIGLLIIFSLDTDLGVVRDDEGRGTMFTVVLVITSLFLTFSTTVSSILGAMNLSKRGQLGVKSKLLLGLSLAFQILARLSVMVMVAVLAVDSVDVNVTPTIGAVLLSIPLLLHWFCILILKLVTVPTFRQLPLQDKLIHLLSNTWVCVPFRTLENQDQRRKVREQFGSLLIAGLNISVTAAVTVITGIDGGNATQVDDEFVLFFCLPSLVFYLLGFLFLFLHYKTCHSWRHLGKERESHCWGKLGDLKGEVRVEMGVWESQVRVERGAWKIHILGIAGLYATLFSQEIIQKEGKELNRVLTQREGGHLVITDQVESSH